MKQQQFPVSTGTATPAAETRQPGTSRRQFLIKSAGIAGIGALAALTSTGCNKDDDDNGINLGSGDIGILNYAYALEQLEAAFYTQVIMSQYSGITASEKSLLTDIRDHEIAHREFFKKALGDKAIPGLEVNFTKIDFSKRDSVLATAKAFEDLGVAAYNGAGKLITNGDYLLLAGKIVSVEARHAGYIRDLISNGSFADSTVVDGSGLDLAKSPSEVLATASGFLKSKINANNLPTT
ncbi:MAG: ferritin-like domain-containing protein [Candidatus Pseudobacter hemicellulosilyticus]|uniref:Ferritin-like domain-containing protein n=1 Tax=Candidatus Pseudobacter hemicellulosilyticus TaxID=3121375 RepID=A0AAJ5WQ47_9BACT|nr:MAG: ferritin-like domain-containing protein [Pseudobacter sp.]